MSENYWLNENAFSNGANTNLDSTNSENGNNNDDFLNSIFDQNQGQPQQSQQQQQTQPQQQQGSDDMLMSSYSPQQDSNYNQSQNLNPQMFIRQAQVQQQQQKQQAAAQQQQLSQGKNEQLYRMKQQILHQKMLHQQAEYNKQQQQEQQQGYNNIPPSQGQSQMNQQQQDITATRSPSGSILPQQQQQGTPVLPNNNIPINVQRNLSQGGTNYASPMANIMSPQMASAMSPPQQQQQQQRQQPQPQQQQPMPAQQQQQQPTPSQTQQQLPASKSLQMQMQVELFLSVLYDFMNRRGTPIPSPVLINNRRINLFFIHVLIQRLGGQQQLQRFIQQPFNRQQPNNSPWFMIGQKLGLYEGVNLNDLNSRERIDREISTCYANYLLPYDEYCATPEGIRDIQQKRAQFQGPIIMRYQQMRQRQQQQQPTPQQQQAQVQQSPQVPQPQVPQQAPVHISPEGSNMSSPGIKQSPMMSNAPTPGGKRRVSRASNPSTGNSPNVANSPYIQQQQLPRSASNQQLNLQQSMLQNQFQLKQQMHQQQQLQQQQQASPEATGPQMVRQASQVSIPTRPGSTSRQSQASPGQEPSNRMSQPDLSSPKVVLKQEVTKEEANILKNYIPIRRVVDTHGGHNIKELSQIASEIEVTKPIYLFAPELGVINIQALVMGLKSNRGGSVPSSEVVNALNTLVVTTSDANYGFRIDDCLELLDALSLLGKDILNRIVDDKVQPDEYISKDVSKLSGGSQIDNVFEKYVNSGSIAGEDIGFVVDSLTGEVVSDEEEEDIEIDDIFIVDATNGPSETTSSALLLDSSVSHLHHQVQDVPYFHISDYLTSLQDFKQENKYHFTKIQTRSATDDKIMLIDELITITMILRNISFSEPNKKTMAGNKLFKDLLFAIVKNIGLFGNKFIFSRKRLCLLKDCLLMLDNIAFYIDLRSLEEAFLSFVLISSFGPKIDDETGYKIPKCNLETHSYFPFAVDAFTKLLVKEPHNRSLLQAVLNGTLNVSLTASYTNNFVVSVSDQEYTRKLIVAYLNNEASQYKSGILLTRSFKLFMSIIPFEANSFEFSKFIFIRAPTISQMLFGAKLIIDLIPIDDLTTHLNKLSLYWILANGEVLFGNFARVVVALSSETGKFGRESNEYKILTLVLTKSLIVVNSLLNNIMITTKLESVEQDQEELIKSLQQVYNLPRIIPDGNISLDTILNPNIDSNLGKEVVRLLRYLNELNHQQNDVVIPDNLDQHDKVMVSV
ncbi:SWI/SNF chromatin-remodeling complex subunit SWI1 [Spathaspora sp. JA1]|nr:SWI/SNF chromatin-remodeling complex subunit SWI1 [Spathaspora sp. JA1]